MRNFNDKMMDKLPTEFLFGFIAILGGIARYLQQYVKGEPFVWRMLIANIFISAFAGFVFTLIGKSLGLQSEAVGAVAGIGGWLGANGIEFVVGLTKARLNLG